MNYRNIRPITVLCQTNISPSARSAVESAIIATLHSAGVWAEYVRRFNSTTGVTYFQKTHSGTDSYIAKAQKESSVTGRINANTLLYAVRDDASRSTEERYDVMLTQEAMHWHKDSTRSVGGVGLESTGAVVSYNSIAHLLQPTKGEDSKSLSRFYLLIKMVAMHELGHVFDLWPYNGPTNATDEDLKNAHCQNECVMQWTITEALANNIKSNPFCKTCRPKLKEFFIQP